MYEMAVHVSFTQTLTDINMYGQRRVNDAVHMYMSELSSRVVAESGRAGDRHHLGKLILQGLREAPPGFILQIDAATGECETTRSVLERSVRCAGALSAAGLARGDVIVLMAPNHLDLCIPYYAALYLGVALAPIDRTLRIKELEQIFACDVPKMVFCQSEKAHDVLIALKNGGVKSKVVTFDDSKDKIENTCTFEDLLKEDGSNEDINQFKASDFDPEVTTALLASTSGTTGLPKQAIHTHKHYVLSGHYQWIAEFTFPQPTRMAFIISPLQRGTVMLQFNNSAIMRYTRVQTSKDIDQDHFYEIVNTYKPSSMIISPTMLASQLKNSKGKCNWSCFDFILTLGGQVSQNLLDEIRKAATGVYAVNCYGFTEAGGAAFIWDHVLTPGSCGKPIGNLQHRLVNVETNEDILEPNVQGELWVIGSTVFKGYYKDPEASKEALSEDGWLRSGDLFYRDEQYNFYFVDRIKMLLKYRNHRVFPAEIQAVIREHPGVQDVAVVGLPDFECGDLPVAAVVKRPGRHVTAQEIKELVRENLADSKRLRGGVMFLERLPVLSVGKLDMQALKKIVIEGHRE